MTIKLLSIYSKKQVLTKHKLERDESEELFGPASRLEQQQSSTSSKKLVEAAAAPPSPSPVRVFVVAIEPLTSDIKLVTLKVKSGVLQFQAGQFIGMYDGRTNVVGESTFPGTFSIASRPSELPLIRFAVGADNNPRNLRHLLYNDTRPGDNFLLDGCGSGTVAISPRMVMTPVGGPGGIMLIGGGSAVMGLVSIVEELLHSEEGRKIPAIKLFHSNRSNKDIPFYERMQELGGQSETFNYFPHVTGKIDHGENSRGHLGRIDIHHVARELAGVRLFCVYGSGVFCEAVVNILLDLGVWPGSIRTDYTTRVDPARRLDELSKASAKKKNTKRFESCTDGMKEKGTMNASDDYLRTYGIDVLLQKMSLKLTEETPDFPLDFLSKEISRVQAELPEVSNINAADPSFWINYWETDTVTWQAPVTSPWLEKYMDKFVGQKQRTVFVHLCGKSLDMKSLLEHGHKVVGADCSGIACVDFFTENNIPDYAREVVPHPDGKHVIRHKSTSVSIALYEGDIFDLTTEIVGKIDRVLDRAALVILHPSMIEDHYLPLLMRLMRPGGKILLASVSELPFPKAPPHVYEAPQIEGILQQYFSKIKMLEVHRYRVNAGFVSEPIYILKSKKKTVR
eukprot:CAMPEP_0119004320 /NCGR_PEP_ID=MMETSP1176-20130426/1073_1 /TAXON_ID=265551 /ORGANISM="Synedropsis recta cf, Strain CCMP1620" /LENGTH=623 /DNA_ID=CAMNT_0006956011 /DNA_START=74 /DNA_END=1945 /DNA_ORIENTATION=+